MLSFIFVLISVMLIFGHLKIDKNIDFLSPIILFQIYYFVQLPLNLFFGSNFDLPRFQAISRHSSNSEIITLGSFIILAQIAIVIFFYAFRFRSSGFKESSKQWPKASVNAFCFLFILIGYLSFSYLLYINGGFAAFIEQRELWRAEGSVGQGWILFPATALMSTSACAVMLNNRDKFIGYTGLFRLLLLYIIIILPASQLGFRSYLLLPLLQIVFFYHNFLKRINIPNIFLFGLFFTVVFTIAGIQREIPYRSIYGSYFEYAQSIYYTRPDLLFTVFLRSMGADISQIAIDHVRMFNDYKMLYPSFVEALTIPIPQAIWSNKPIALSVQFSREVMGINGGVSPTIVGEGYWHGGILGILGLAAILGMLFRIFENLKSLKNSNMGAALLMLSIYPSLIMMSEAFQGYFNGLFLLIILNFIMRQLFTLGYGIAADHPRAT